MRAADGIRRAAHGIVDRVLSVGYGVVYDFIFERFPPYQALKRELVELVERSISPGTRRGDVRILELGCGPGNLSLALAQAGFSVVGIDPYGALVDLAREKRRAQQLVNLTFQHAPRGGPADFPEAAFDQVVNIHSLYVHPAPHELLTDARRVLKPGGHAIFVNFTRRVPVWPTLRDVGRRDGQRAALGAALWLVPNAVFEAVREPIGPHHWREEEFAARMRDAGFTVLEMRRTFFNDVSLLVWATKPP